MPIPPPPVLPSVDEAYDLLMKDIEPDLVTNQLPLLDKKYAGETPVEQKARIARYNKAFALFEKKRGEYFRQIDEMVRKYKRTAMKEAENTLNKREADSIAQLEQAIFSLK